jgi:hypothetical protein
MIVIPGCAFCIPESLYLCLNPPDTFKKNALNQTIPKAN